MHILLFGLKGKKSAMVSYAFPVIFSLYARGHEYNPCNIFIIRKSMWSLSVFPTRFYCHKGNGIVLSHWVMEKWTGKVISLGWKANFYRTFMPTTCAILFTWLFVYVSLHINWRFIFLKIRPVLINKMEWKPSQERLTYLFVEFIAFIFICLLSSCRCQGGYSHIRMPAINPLWMHSNEHWESLINPQTLLKWSISLWSCRLYLSSLHDNKI